MKKILTITWLLGLVFVMALVQAAAVDASDKITICHATGNGQYITLTLPPKAVFGKNGASGHFNEQGTPNAGHENDYLGPCTPPPTTTTQPPATTTTSPPSTTSPTTTSTTSSSTSTTSTVATTTTAPKNTSTSSPATTTPDQPTTTACTGICGGGEVTTVPERVTTTSIAVDTCEQIGSCESTTTTPDGSTTTSVVTTSTLATTGTGSNIAVSGIASLLVGLGLLATRLARRVV